MSRAASHYQLRCYGCGQESSDAGYQVYCPTCGKDALLLSVYRERLALLGPPDQFLSYRGWLPFTRTVVPSGPQMAASPAPELGAQLGLDDLWVLISAWAPERGATFETGSFKEVEALGVLSRVTEQTSKTLIISSAGNAARAFLEYATRAGLPAVVVVPGHAEPWLTVAAKPGACAPLLLLLEDAYYLDAIRFVDAATAEFSADLVREGGAFNVARRDAMGVPVLHAALAMERLPDVYVQAVGSGTGALAAREAAERLRAFGLVEPFPMRLVLAQNAPFTPMVDAWRAGSRQVVRLSDEAVRDRLSRVAAKVLSNATPPYSMKGGVYDALRWTHGDMLAVTNEEIEEAARLIEATLGFRPCAAASAAGAALRSAVRSGVCRRNERILLHLTGGGLERLQREGRVAPYPDRERIGKDDTARGFELISGYLARHGRLHGDPAPA